MSRSASRASTRIPFWQAGHAPTLLAALLYFNFTFMVWVMLGPLAVQIGADLQLSPAEQGLMIATPLLAGAVLRVALGMLADRLQPRLAGAVGQGVVIVALALAWLIGVTSYAQVLALGVVLGLAGASFAVALRLASGIYPPEHQGTALGITGAGNFGTVLAALCAPGLGAAVGWQNVIGLALVPLIPAFAYYLLVARDSAEPAPPTPGASYLQVLRDHDALWFMFFYAVSFGGFVGLASYLTVYFSTRYGLPPQDAGYCTAVCAAVGSLLRPLGVRIAERLGGIRALALMYGSAAALLTVAALGLDSLAQALCVFSAAMLALGLGNGALFQVAPQRFRHKMGIMTAMIGMAGAAGGFVLAAALGYSQQATGDYQAGLLLFAALALVALLGLWNVKSRWRSLWRAGDTARA
jgi:NNP family nitrate/nitrite transporter-like MFS transporter